MSQLSLRLLRAALLVPTLLFACVATANAAGETGVFLAPANNEWVAAGSSYPILADAGPGTADSGKVVFNGIDATGCAPAMILPMALPPGAGPNTLQCSWDTTGLATGAHTLELWIGESANPAVHVMAADITVNIDASAPTPPSGVQDDAATPTMADVDQITGSGDVTVRWTPGSDGESGLAGQNWCIATNTSCTSPLRSGTVGAAVTSTTASGTALADNVTYYSCVQSGDLAGNFSAFVCSDGFKADVAPPTVPGGVLDDSSPVSGSDIDTSTGGDTVVAWTASTDTVSGVASYDWCISAAANCTTPLRSGSTASTSARATGTALGDGTYFSCVRAVDNVGHASAYACSDGYIVATTLPAPPTEVRDGYSTVIDGIEMPLTDTLGDSRINWTASADAPAGIAGYNWCVNTAANCTGPLRQGTAAADAETVLATGAAYTNKTTYYSCVASRSAGGVLSAYVCSNGFLVDTTPSHPVTCPSGTTKSVKCATLTVASAKAHKCGVGQKPGTVFVGTTAAEVINGTKLDDCIVSGGGLDVITAKEGADTIIARSAGGTKLIDAGSGDNTISAVATTGNNFKIVAGVGNDTIVATSTSGRNGTITDAGSAKITATAKLGNSAISCGLRCEVKATASNGQNDAIIVGAGKVTAAADANTVIKATGKYGVDLGDTTVIAKADDGSNGTISIAGDGTVTATAHAGKVTRAAGRLASNGTIVCTGTCKVTASAPQGRNTTIQIGGGSVTATSESNGTIKSTGNVAKKIAGDATIQATAIDGGNGTISVAGGGSITAYAYVNAATLRKSPDVGSNSSIVCRLTCDVNAKALYGKNKSISVGAGEVTAKAVSNSSIKSTGLPNVAVSDVTITATAIDGSNGSITAVSNGKIKATASAVKVKSADNSSITCARQCDVTAKAPEGKNGIIKIGAGTITATARTNGEISAVGIKTIIGDATITATATVGNNGSITTVAGNDTITARAPKGSNLKIAAGNGNNTINASGKANGTVTAGSGDDVITVTANGGKNGTVNAGAGNNTVTVKP